MRRWVAIYSKEYENDGRNLRNGLLRKNNSEFEEILTELLRGMSRGL